MKWAHAISDYAHYLRIERGLSANTIHNYTLDIQKLVQHLESHKIESDPLQIEHDEQQAFVYEVAKSVNARSQARLISGLRSFFGFLVFEDYRSDNPTDLIESPKIGRKLPDTLSVAEIDRIMRELPIQGWAESS